MHANEINLIPVNKIFSDPTFNCRGHIAPIDVIDLAKDIEKHGLQQPIVVQSLDNGSSYSHKLISGHRRHRAFQVLKIEEIPCIINDEISEADALILNLGENLHRRDLNILQEARALERLKLAGLSTTDVAAQLSKSSTWVLVRYKLLELPDVIQEAAAAGFITQAQISDLHTLGDMRKQIEAAKKIKSAKARGEKVPKVLKPKRDMFKRRARDPDEIEWMMSHIREGVGNNFGTRCLAWAAGNISDLELFRDIEELAIQEGVNYNIPYDLAKHQLT